MMLALNARLGLTHISTEKSWDEKPAGQVTWSISPLAKRSALPHGPPPKRSGSVVSADDVGPRRASGRPPTRLSTTWLVSASSMRRWPIAPGGADGGAHATVQARV